MTDFYCFWNCPIETGLSIPRREFDLIEFYKLIKKTNTIISVELNTEEHMIIFHVKQKSV